MMSFEERHACEQKLSACNNELIAVTAKVNEAAEAIKQACCSLMMPADHLKEYQALAEQRGEPTGTETPLKLFFLSGEDDNGEGSGLLCLCRQLSQCQGPDKK